MTMRFSEVGVTREDQIHPVLFAKRQEFLLLFKRWIGQDESVCSDVLTGEENPFPAAGEDHVGVGHEHQGHHHIPAQVPHQSEDLVCGDDAFQRPEAGPLDHRHFGGGIGEEDPLFHQIGAVVHGGPDCSGLQIRIAAGDQWDKRLPVNKSICDLFGVHRGSISPKR